MFKFSLHELFSTHFLWLFPFFSCLAAVKAGPHFLLPKIFPVSYSYESPTVSALSLTLEDPCQGGFHSYVVTCLSFFLSVYLACQALATSFSHITKIISRGHERHTHSTLPFLLSVGVMITIWMGPWASSGLIWRLPSLQFRPLFSDPEDRRSLLVQCNHVSRKSVFLCISCMLVPWLPCAYSSDAHLHPACMARCDVLRVYGMKL